MNVNPSNILFYMESNVHIICVPFSPSQVNKVSYCKKSKGKKGKEKSENNIWIQGFLVDRIIGSENYYE